MSWVRIDDAFADHPKVLPIGPTALAVHVWALCYSAKHLTDGLVTFGVLKGCPWVSKRSALISAVERLVGSGLWEWAEGGFALHDFHDYNPTAAKVREERRLSAERQARWRSRKEQRSNGVTTTVTEEPRNAYPLPAPKGGGKAAAPWGAPLNQIGEEERGEEREEETAPPPPEVAELIERAKRERARRAAS